MRLFLGSIEDIIRFQVQKIYSKQEGGYWPVTTGDKIFIEYMNNTLAAIEEALRKSPVGQKEWRTLINRLEQMLARSETEHNPKIKAVFLAQETFTWPSFESVYEAFAADPACEAQLVYVPFEHVNSDKKRDYFTEYKDMGLPIIHCDNYDLSAESPDLVFFVKPYDGIPKKFYIENVDRIAQRSVYIPYGANWVDYQNVPLLIRYHFQLPLQDKAWKIFDTPDYLREYYIHYGNRNGENVELIGHPRFDSIRKFAKMRDSIPLIWKKKIEKRKVFMWNTHFSNRNDGQKDSDWATFELFGQNMLSYFKLDKEVILLWRPHPLFFNSLLNNKIMTSQELEELIITIDNSENIILDTLSDYRYAFSATDALISDASSLLLEFLAIGKPVLYTYQGSRFSIVNKNLLPAYYKATKWIEIEKFIQNVKEEKDPKKRKRMEVLEKFDINYGKTIGEIVREFCITNMIKEETVSGNVHNEKN